MGIDYSVPFVVYIEQGSEVVWLEMRLREKVKKFFVIKTGAGLFFVENI